MFDFLFKNREKEIQSLLDVIMIDVAKLNLSKLAIDDCKSHCEIRHSDSDRQFRKTKMGVPVECPAE